MISSILYIGLICIVKIMQPRAKKACFQITECSYFQQRYVKIFKCGNKKAEKMGIKSIFSAFILIFAVCC